MPSFEVLEEEGKLNGSTVRFGKFTVNEGVIYLLWELDHLHRPDKQYKLAGSAVFPAKKPEEG